MKSDTQQGLGLAFDELGAFPLCKATARRLLGVQDLQAVANVKPTKTVEEVLVCLLTIVGLCFIWKHRKAVITLLTGDDRVHLAIPDACWYGVFQCCGLCKFEWCDCVTNWPCFGRFRGVNPMKLAAQKLGVMSRTVELSNIVVGDLPLNEFGNFYLEIEYGKYPEIVSSVQEDRDPRVVHFPEVITVRIRESALDYLVHISVKQTRLVGTYTLCEVKLDPRSVGMWAMESDEHSTKRFAMNVVEGTEGDTPPWISLTFGIELADLRSLERYRPNLGHTATVRLATWNSYNASTGEMYEEQPLVDMKKTHPLVDGRGNIVQEPAEGDLALVKWLRSCLVCLQSIMGMVVGLGFVTYHILRHYVRMCYGMFETLTIAKSWDPHEFPMPSCALRSIQSVCAAKLKGTGLKEGDHMCLPTDLQVEDTCDTPPQTRPKVFGWFMEDMGLGSDRGIQCFDDVCHLNNRIKQYDSVAFWGSLAALIFVFCLFRPCANSMLTGLAASQQERRNRRARQSMHDGI